MIIKDFVQYVHNEEIVFMKRTIVNKEIVDVEVVYDNCKEEILLGVKACGNTLIIYI